MEPIGRVVVNVRDVQPGDVFWALDTAEHDAGARAEDAFAQGALGAVVVGRHVEPWAGKFSMVVQDASCALWQLAAWLRRQFPGQLIAVTGDAGRTAAARMIVAVLRERFVGTSPALDAKGRLGLPLSMLALDASHDFALVECSAGQLDEVGALSDLCCPDIAVINCVAAGATPDAEPTGVLETLGALPDDCWAVLNGDIPRMPEVASYLGGRVLSVGQDSQCDVVACDVCSRPGELSFVTDGVPFRVPISGRHHLHSALAAFAVGRIMNLLPDEIAVALSRFPPAECSREVRMDDVMNGVHLGTSSVPEAV